MGLKAVEFTTPGSASWNPPVGSSAAIGSLWGGGGGGNGSQSFGANGNGGGGGGSAEQCEGRFIPVGATVAIIVGAGGATGPNQAPAADAGASSIDGTTIALGATQFKSNKNPSGSGADGHWGGQGGGCRGGNGAIATTPAVLGNLEGGKWTGGNGAGQGGPSVSDGKGAPGTAQRSATGVGNRAGGGGANSPFGAGGNGGNDNGSVGTSPAATAYGAGGGGTGGNSLNAGVPGAKGRVVIFYSG